MKPNSTTENHGTISAAEAKASLESLNKINASVAKTLRPPLWFIALMGASFGLMTFSYSAMRHENVWTLGLIASFVVFIILVALLLYRNRLLGVKMRLSPSSRSGMLLQLAQAGAFTVALFFARELSLMGYEWAAYGLASFNALLMASMLYLFPTGEWIQQGKRHE